MNVPHTGTPRTLGAIFGGMSFLVLGCLAVIASVLFGWVEPSMMLVYFVLAPWTALGIVLGWIFPSKMWGLLKVLGSVLPF